jgi:hypothetical protein
MNVGGEAGAGQSRSGPAAYLAVMLAGFPA